MGETSQYFDRGVLSRKEDSTSPIFLVLEFKINHHHQNFRLPGLQQQMLHLKFVADRNRATLSQEADGDG